MPPDPPRWRAFGTLFSPRPILKAGYGHEIAHISQVMAYSMPGTLKLTVHKLPMKQTQYQVSVLKRQTVSGVSKEMRCLWCQYQVSVLKRHLCQSTVWFCVYESLPGSPCSVKVNECTMMKATAFKTTNDMFWYGQRLLHKTNRTN